MQALRWKSQFFTIWTGQAVSLITSAILQMAIILYLTETTGSALILSLASLVGFLPYAVLGPFIGVLVDRYNRKHIMILSDLVIALAAAILALAALSGELPVWLVMVILFVRSVGTAFHTPSLSAVTPLLVPQDMLAKCAGYSQAIQSVSLLLSPALAAFLYMAWNLTAVIALDVAGAVIASLTVAWVKIPGLTKPQQTEPLHFFKEMKEGFLALRSNKGLFALLWIGFLFTFIYMPINALFPLMSMEHFEGTAFHVSVVEIAFALGMLAGGLALGALGALKNRYLMIAASIALIGLGLAVSGLLPPSGFLLFAASCLVMGFAAPFYAGVQTALVQEKIQPQYLGRVFSLLGSVQGLAMPLGLILSGMFADGIGVSRWFLVSGMLLLSVAMLAFLLPAMKKLE
ncbi:MULTISPECIES: MFS transporter [Sphaerochaeta]|jgi:DHA3 family macrolide efflux protein-like MFS transporter|uniref:Major facilitator superfamily (MFS) profile domain-containing protein n=1 Tax=bioreactor metagenome TaxID=1076179 RepID=A0A644X722_9ZZZZ|nr:MULTISPECIES: MFS transporter [Sphaerochaeta]MDD3456612.1 MFS transporter [Sphaerochaeta sp.]MDD4038978.1 MFS transporter [Sphaerochaeta sp.]MDD4450592.1 MFS transporter [Sphaerochaeta sp.]MDX9983275.1 MFS transporter [Sphaerochaeta sp.]MEA5029624.1 MFS transporter [Sphaerochaeta associata]